MKRQITLQDFLTNSEITKCQRLFHKCRTEKLIFAEECRREVIEPIMAKINKKLGGENDPKFLSYAVEYVMTISTK